MRTDKLLINADSETIAAFNRALALKAAAALTLVFSFAVIALTAPAHASVSRGSVELSAASGSEPLVTDKHDFINPQRSVEAVERRRSSWSDCSGCATTPRPRGPCKTMRSRCAALLPNSCGLRSSSGDSDRLLAWWRLNKETEHQALLGARDIGSCARDA